MIARRPTPRRSSSAPADGGITLWSLDDSSAPPPGPFICVVPGEAVAVHRLELPARVRGAARLKVARTLLRLRLASPGAEIVAVPLDREREDWDALLVADAAQVRRWNDRAGPACIAILPDFVLLPEAGDGVWLLRQKGGRLLMREGGRAGFAAETDLAALLLARMMALSRPRQVIALTPLDAPIAALLETSGLPPSGSDAAPLRHHPAARLREMDLAGEDRRAGGGPASLRAHRLSIVLLVLALGLWVSDVLRETMRLQEQAARHRVLAEEMVRATLIPNGPLPDLRAQVLRALEARAAASSSSEPGAMPLIHRMSMAIAGRDVEIRSLDYDRSQGVLLELEAPDFATTERVMEGLRNGALVAEVLTSRTGGETTGSVRSSVRVRP